MKEIFTFGLLGFVGISLGALLKFRPKNSRSNQRAEPLPTPAITQAIELDSGVFSPQEITFLQQLILANNTDLSISTLSLINILALEALPQTHKRLVCNKFLRSLNLKILVRYGLKDAIVSSGSDQDKRKKCYQLDHSFFYMFTENVSNNALFTSNR
jgi:hypothetical protein